MQILAMQTTVVCFHQTKNGKETIIAEEEEASITTTVKAIITAITIEKNSLDQEAGRVHGLNLKKSREDYEPNCSIT